MARDLAKKGLASSYDPTEGQQSHLSATTSVRPPPPPSPRLPPFFSITQPCTHSHKTLTSYRVGGYHFSALCERSLHVN